MRRGLAAALSALLLMALIPGPVAADRVTRFEDHHVGFFCEMAIDGGVATAHIDVSSEFGNGAGSEVWLDPAVPFEDPPTLGGGTEQVSLVDASGVITLSATFIVFDADGSRLGEGVIEATLTPDGPLEVLESSRFGNRNSKVEGTFQPMAVSGTLSLPGLETDLSGCFGDVTDIQVRETNPHTFVLSNEGVFVDCFWETAEASAHLFAITDSFGSFAEASLTTAGLMLFSTGEYTAEVTAGSMAATVGLFDPATGETAEAVAEATLSPIGDPVTSVILSSTSREKILEQRFSPSGELRFSTGQTFAIDDASCFSVGFDSHLIDSAPSGPKPGGPVPVNDTPEGAIALVTGSRLNAQTGGASLDPEEPITTCPEGELDAMGRTLWYTIEGTGGEVTIDTAGSNFDTVLAVYRLDGTELTEVACIDDVFGEPLGVAFQAALTLETVEGATYYIQVGGFDERIFGGDVQFGRLRLRIT